VSGATRENNALIVIAAGGPGGVLAFSAPAVQRRAFEPAVTAQCGSGKFDGPTGRYILAQMLGGIGRRAVFLYTVAFRPTTDPAKLGLLLHAPNIRHLPQAFPL